MRLFFGIGVLFWGSFALAHLPGLSTPRLVTFNDVQNWLTDPASPARSVDELLHRLPEAYRGHAVSLYESKSNHLASSENPRLVFYGPDAKLLMAVSSDPADPRYHTVEMIEYVSSKARFEFATVDFAKQPPAIERNPSSCVRCHRRSDPRPNWEPYDVWPGVYGSVHDRISPDTHEHASFERFIRNIPHNPRLRHLVSPFFMKQSSWSGKPIYYTVNGHSGSNAVLTHLLNYLNRDRITHRILESKDHEKYKFAILASLISCSDPESFLPVSQRLRHSESYASVLQDTRIKITHDFERRIRKSAKQLGIEEAEVENKADTIGLTDDAIERMAKLRYLLESRKQDPVPVKDWSMSVHQTSYDLNDGGNGLANLVGHYFPKAFPLRDVPELPFGEVPFVISWFNPQTPYEFSLFKLEEPTPQLCDDLRNASLQAF